jgi:hypothetical protein
MLHQTVLDGSLPTEGTGLPMSSQVVSFVKSAGSTTKREQSSSMREKI